MNKEKYIKKLKDIEFINEIFVIIFFTSVFASLIFSLYASLVSLIFMLVFIIRVNNIKYKIKLRKYIRNDKY